MITKRISFFLLRLTTATAVVVFFQVHRQSNTRRVAHAFETTTSSRLRRKHPRRLPKRHLQPIIMCSLANDNNINEIEKEVYASTRARLDLQRVQNAFMADDADVDDDDDILRTSTSSVLSTMTTTRSKDRNIKNNDPQKVATMASPWKVSLASASAVTAFVVLATNASLLIAGIVFVAVFFIANGDPLEEDDENVTGSMARFVGRYTIQSVESSKPKLKAIARAAISDQEEIGLLKGTIRQLQTENKNLKLWKQRRMIVDQSLSFYTLEELKDMARRNKLPVGGTKSQLMMRLLENDVPLNLKP